jgi:hypothetical protein
VARARWVIFRQGRTNSPVARPFAIPLRREMKHRRYSKPRWENERNRHDTNQLLEMEGQLQEAASVSGHSPPNCSTYQCPMRLVHVLSNKHVHPPVRTFECAGCQRDAILQSQPTQGANRRPFWD